MLFGGGSVVGLVQQERRRPSLFFGAFSNQNLFATICRGIFFPCRQQTDKHAASNQALFTRAPWPHQAKNQSKPEAGLPSFLGGAISGWTAREKERYNINSQILECEAF